MTPVCGECGGTGTITVKFVFGEQEQDCVCTAVITGEPLGDDVVQLMRGGTIVDTGVTS